MIEETKKTSSPTVLNRGIIAWDGAQRLISGHVRWLQCSFIHTHHQFEQFIEVGMLQDCF